MKKAISKSTIKLMSKLKKKELSDYVTKAIFDNDNRKVAIIKQAHLLGCDLVDPYVNAVRANDLLSLALCLNYGVSVNWSDTDGKSIAHICAMKNNDVLLKSLILRGLKINCKTVDGLTPLQFALFGKNYECIRELIINNAEMVWTINMGDKIDSSDKYEVNALTLMFENLEDEANIKYRNIIELIVGKLDSLTTNNFNELRKLVLYKKLDLAKIILSKFPRALNELIGRSKYTILSVLIDGKHTELVNEFIQKDSTNLNPNIVKPYLHQLAGVYDINNVIYLLNKHPDHINKLCESLRTSLDHLLIHFEANREDEFMAVLDVLVAAGCNLNNRNNQKFRTIETAMQYTNTKIIRRLIEAGINIREPILDGSDYFLPMENNDILAFAAQIGNIEILDLFFEHNVFINLYQSTPTAVLLAIKGNKKDVVIHLMDNNKIKSICMKKCIKRKLLDYSINTGAANKKIMTCFSTIEHIDSLKLNVKQTIFNNFEKNFSDFINKHDDYDNYRGVILLTTDLKLFFLMQWAITKSIDDLGSIINTWMKLHIFNDFPYAAEINNILMALMMQTMGNNITETFSICMDITEAIFYSKNNDETKRIYCKMIEIRQLHLKNIIKKIEKLQKMVNSCQSIEYSNEKYSLHYTNSNTINTTNTVRIDDMLIRLRYPIKQPHYESMRSKLIGINCVLSETDSYISVHDNDTGITATIFKLSNISTPSKWFDFYCHNIGKDTKSDFTHMFPFILDKKMYHIQCFEKSSKDNVNGFGSIFMAYFYGTLCVDDKLTSGVFEYFIDSTKTLFHRFFRPYAQLSSKKKLVFLKNIPESLCEKVLFDTI